MITIIKPAPDYRTMIEWEEHDKRIIDNLSRCIFGLKHKIIYEKGKGYFCKRCGKPLSQCHKKKDINKMKYKIYILKILT